FVSHDTLESQTIPPCKTILTYGRFAGRRQRSIQTKGPGEQPGPRNNGAAGRSGGGLVVFRRAGLDRLDDLGRDLLGELGELLGLGAERLEALAAVRGPQLRRLGGGLHP